MINFPGKKSKFVNIRFGMLSDISRLNFHKDLIFYQYYDLYLRIYISSSEGNEIITLVFILDQPYGSDHIYSITYD